MRKSMKQRVALFLSFAMAFTSVDSSVLAAAADTTEIMSEDVQQEEISVQNEEASADELAVEENEEAQPEESAITEEELVEENEIIGEEDADGADDQPDVISETEEDGTEEQLLGEDLYEMDGEAAAVEENETVPLSEEDSFADSVASAIPLEFDTNYTVELNGEKTCEWFRYTAQEETAVVFQATGDADNYVEVYDGVGNTVTENDDDGEGSNFWVKMTVHANETYYFKARMFNEGVEGTFYVSLTQTVAISSITNIVLPENRQSISELYDVMGSGTSYTIKYTDGNSEDITIDESGFRGKNGDYIEYRFKRQDDNSKTYFYGEDTPAGKYALVFYVNGEELCATGYEFENVDAENAGLPELEVGSNEITGGQNDTWNWYRFNATEGTKYYVDRCNGFQVRTKINGKMEGVSTNRDSFKATQSGTYYLGFSSAVWDEETGKRVYTWTANIVIGKEIANITVGSLQGTRQIAGLESNYLGQGTEYTITYTDNDKEPAVIENNGYTDRYGNYIEYRFYKKNDESESYYYNYWTDKSIGDYKLVFAVDGNKIQASEEYEYSVINVEDANLPELTVGEQEIQSAEDSKVWYRFEAKANTKYRIDRYNTLDVYTSIDGKMTAVDVNNSAFKTTQGGWYYLGFRYGTWNNEGEKEYTWTANISEVAEIKSITVKTLRKSRQISDLDLYYALGNNTEFMITYSDREPEYGKIDSSGHTDPYGNYIEYRFYKKGAEDETSYYDYWTDKPEGEYRLAFYVDGEEISSVENTFEVVKAEDAELPFLNAGVNEIQSGEYNRNWYQFKAEADAKYQIDRYNNLSVYTKSNNEMTMVEVYNGSFKTEQAGIYYLGFQDGIPNEDGEKEYTWTASLNRVKRVTAIQVKPGKTQFYQEEYPVILSSIGFTYSGEDGEESKTFDVDGWNDIDGLGNSVNIFLTADESEEKFWPGNELNAGVYTVHVQLLDDKTVEDTYTITILEEDTPFNGKAEVTELVLDQNYRVKLDADKRMAWFSYKPEKEMTIIFKSFGDVDDDCDTYGNLYDSTGKCLKEDDEGGDDGNFALTYKLEAGETYYFRARMYSMGRTGQFFVTLKEKARIVGIESVTPADKLYIAHLDTDITSGTSVVLKYNNDKTAGKLVSGRAYIKDEYGYRLTFGLLNEKNEAVESDDDLPAGNYALAVYADGEQVAVSDCVYKVKNASEAGLTELKTGENVAIRSKWNASHPNWYQFKAEKTGRYRFEKYSDMKAAYFTDDGEKQNVSVNKGSFRAEEGKVYYIGFYGECETDDDYVTSWKTRFSEVPAVTAIKATPKNTEFYAGIWQKHASFEVQLTYEDNTTAAFSEWSSAENIDGKGNGINVYITSDADSNSSYGSYDELEPGNYTVHVALNDDETVEDVYKITVLEEPTPFNGKAEAVILKDGESYNVNVDETKIFQWFRYTAAEDIPITFWSEGQERTYLHVYNQNGEELYESGYNSGDDYDNGYNFKIYDTLKAGTTYYFKVNIYNLGNKGNFTVRLRENLKIQTLEVVKSDLKTVYPLNGEFSYPSVWLRATYNREGVSDTFYWSDGDRWENAIENEILDEEGNTVNEIKQAGTYTYRLKCGTAAVTVGKFQAMPLQEMTKQEISVDQEKQLNAEESRLIFRFSVQERGMYRLTSNAPIGDLKLYDQNEKKIQFNGVDYHGYAVLDPGTYYVCSELESGITKLRVSVKKATLPQKVTAVFDGEPLIAGVDALGADNISARVEYTDGNSAWLYGEATDVYNDRYYYEIVSEDGEQEYYMGDELPAGTYTVEPKVSRSFSYWGIWHTEEEEALLNQVLTSGNRKSVTVTVTKPDVSQMTPISENEDVEVKGGERRYFYAFTAKESGKYEIESEDGPDQTVLYSDGENKLIRKGNLISLKEGETCVVLANHRFDYKFRMVKQKSDSQTLAKSVQSFKIQSEQDYLITGDIEESLFLLVTYTDGTTEKVSMPYLEDDFTDPSQDSYGNEFDYKVYPKKIVKDGSTYMRYEVVCGKMEATAEFPLYNPEEKAIEITTKKPADGRGNKYFKFVPDESRTYILRITAKEQGARIDRCTTYAVLEDSYSGMYKGQMIWQAMVDLKEGETYYFKAMADSDLDYTVSVLVPKNITDLQIIEVPKSYEIYQGIENYNYDGFKVKVTYEDGSEEILEEEDLSENGTRLWIYDRLWVNENLYRIEMKCGKYKTCVDISAKTWTYTDELKEEVLTNVKADSKLKVYSFTPLENGTYRFGTTKPVGYQLTVYNSTTQKSVGGWYSRYVLQKGVKYTVAFYLDKVDGTEFGIWTDRGQEHIHDYVADRQEPTCVDSGYTRMICSICGAVEEGSYKELTATGHKFGDWITTVESTCTDEGMKYRICSVCEEKEEVPIPAIAHRYVTDRKDSTCTSTGYTQEKCSVCGTVKDGSRKEIARKAHQMKTVVDKKATCGVAGSQHRVCSVCGTKEKATAIAATGKHSFGSYVVTKKATLFAKGSETRTCKVCGRKETRAIAQIPGTIKLTVSKIPLQVGKTAELSRIVTGLTKGDSVASYTSANTKMAVVTKTGKVTGKAAGNVKVTIKLKSGKSAAVTIAVQKTAVATTAIQNLPKTLNLKLQEKKQLSPVIAPISTTDKLSYASSDAKVVAVTGKGLLTARKAGKARITVKSGKKSFVITVTVTAPAPTGMKNLATAVTLNKGKTLVLKPVLLPAGAQANITYKSSNTKVATVDAKGKITAKGKGTAQITITAGKVKKTCKVTVK